jgi:hypothetical protein
MNAPILHESSFEQSLRHQQEIRDGLHDALVNCEVTARVCREFLWLPDSIPGLCYSLRCLSGRVRDANKLTAMLLKQMQETAPRSIDDEK